MAHLLKGSDLLKGSSPVDAAVAATPVYVVKPITPGSFNAPAAEGGLRLDQRRNRLNSEATAPQGACRPGDLAAAFGPMRTWPKSVFGPHANGRSWRHADPRRAMISSAFAD
jgi:hypothetical protein